MWRRNRSTHFGKIFERDGFHSLHCTKIAGRFSRHATLNSFVKQTLGSLDFPSMLEARVLYKTKGKCPDGVTMIPWELVKTTCVGCHVCRCSAGQPSCLNQDSLFNSRTTATETEACKSGKFGELIDNGNSFQPKAIEVPSSSDERSETFITRPCKTSL